MHILEVLTYVCIHEHITVIKVMNRSITSWRFLMPLIIPFFPPALPSPATSGLLSLNIHLNYLEFYKNVIIT